MKSFLKRYKVTVTTVAPVCICSGNEIGKGEYIFDGKKIYIVDLVKLYAMLRERNLIDKYNKYIATSKPYELNLKRWFDSIKFYDYKSISVYEHDGVENLDFDKSLKNINTCMKNAYNEPYVPGSSLKGMIRTALLAKEVSNGHFENVSKQAFNVFNNEFKGSRIKSELGRISDKIEKQVFSETINDESVSIMRGISISDSEPLSLNDIVLCQKIDVNTQDKEKKMNVLRECIRPDVKITFIMTIDEKKTKYTVDDIKDALYDFSDNYDYVVSRHFMSDGLDGEDLYLGAGTGFFSKTVVYNMFSKDVAVQYTKTFLLKTTDKKHGHIKDREISPHTKKMTKIGSKLYDMGRIDIEIEEI